jgi:hypothetical protein
MTFGYWASVAASGELPDMAGTRACRSVAVLAVNLPDRVSLRELS